MGFEVAIYAFAVQPQHLDPANWNEESGFATCKAICANASFKCDLDRRFDWLDWSLQQIGSVPHSSWAIRGKEHIAPAARSVQGFPIRWNPSRVCNEISSVLDGVNQATLRSVIDYDAMAAAHLYKVETAERNVLTSVIVEDFRDLHAFYARTSRMGLAALIYKD